MTRIYLELVLDLAKYSPWLSLYELLIFLIYSKIYETIFVKNS